MKTIFLLTSITILFFNAHQIIRAAEKIKNPSLIESFLTTLAVGVELSIAIFLGSMI